MANYEQVLVDHPYAVPYLDHGFVALVNHMGTDDSVEFATRMSYGKGTRTVSDTRNLLRYLVRHYHTSPIEMAEVVFWIKVPIFVMRQLVRHRTASLNEYSARYSELTDEFYIPEVDRVAKQSTTNKQGSGDGYTEEGATRIQEIMAFAHGHSLEAYQHLLETFDLSRELARGVMPVNGYTEVVWKCDLKNFFHMCKLRMDPHAQKEVRDLAESMYMMVKPLFPILCQAFEDYWLHGVTLSRFEVQALQDIIREYCPPSAVELAIKTVGNDNVHVYDGAPLSKREITEFVNKFQPA